VPTEPASIANVRSPSLDLDSVYGAGPSRSARLYDPADSAKLKVGFGGAFEDLPRTREGSALIADPRNDENLIIAGCMLLSCCSTTMPSTSCVRSNPEPARARLSTRLGA
jgi:hypothetical protein